MKTVRAVAELRAELAAPRRAAHTIGLVPTMGALHEGHLSLIQRARERCDVVVVRCSSTRPSSTSRATSPPTRATRRAIRSWPPARAPTSCSLRSVDQVYPPGFATTVSVAGVTEVLEGAHRGRDHFDGVTTVVTKLLNMVMPDVAYFGQKDAQQAV